MLARTLGSFTLGMAATLYACSIAPAQTSNDQDQPQKKFDKKDFDKKDFKGFGGKGGFGKGGFGKGGFKGGFGKGFPGGKGEPKKDDAKAGETKKSDEKLDAATVKARYEMYKKMYEDNQRETQAKSIEARLDRLIAELQSLRSEIRGGGSGGGRPKGR